MLVLFLSDANKTKKSEGAIVIEGKVHFSKSSMSSDIKNPPRLNAWLFGL